VRQTFYILTITLLLTACNQNGSTNNTSKVTDTTSSEKLPLKTNAEPEEQVAKRLSFQNVTEIAADSSYSTWVELQGKDGASLALHFQYKDTLAVLYSPECWLMYPYKLDGDKIVVFWDNNIDTKYDFDIVKAINKTDKKYLGKPFMILELENDTTFRATYPMQELIRRINSSSKERKLFPDRYIIAQGGFL
jgi:hypothetical protein